MADSNESNDEPKTNATESNDANVTETSEAKSITGDKSTAENSNNGEIAASNTESQPVTTIVTTVETGNHNSDASPPSPRPNEDESKTSVEATQSMEKSPSERDIETPPEPNTVDSPEHTVTIETEVVQTLRRRLRKNSDDEKYTNSHYSKPLLSDKDLCKQLVEVTLRSVNGLTDATNDSGSKHQPVLWLAQEKDECLRLRFFVQCPLIIALLVFALIGTVIERCFGSCNVIFADYLQTIANESSDANRLQYLIMAIRFLLIISYHAISFGKSLREISLFSIKFWFKYWHKLDLQRDGVVKQMIHLLKYFRHLYPPEKYRLEDRIQSPPKTNEHQSFAKSKDD